MHGLPLGHAPTNQPFQSKCLARRWCHFEQMPMIHDKWPQARGPQGRASLEKTHVPWSGPRHPDAAAEPTARSLLLLGGSSFHGHCCDWQPHTHTVSSFPAGPRWNVSPSEALLATRLLGGWEPSGRTPSPVPWQAPHSIQSWTQPSFESRGVGGTCCFRQIWSIFRLLSK